MINQVINNINFCFLSDSLNTNTSLKIQGYRDREIGWHCGDGVPASSTTIELALDILKFYGSLFVEATDAFFGVEGEIRITAYHNKTYIEITITDNNHADLLIEQDGKEIKYIESAPIEKIKKQTLATVKNIWNLSMFLEKNGMIPKSNVSRVLHFTKEMELYHSSQEDVPNLYQAESVAI